MLRIVNVPLVDRRGRRLRSRRPGSGGRPDRAGPPHRIAARAGRPDDGGHRAVRCRPQPQLLQPALRRDDRARPRLARREARIRSRPRARCATTHRLPEARDFPAWKNERRDWFTSADEVVEEEWMLPEWRPSARRRAAAARRRAAPLPRGSHRAASARFGARHACCGCVRRPSTICSRRSASSPATGGSTCGTAASSRIWELDEEWLADASARRRAGAGDGAQARQPDRRGADPRDGPPDDQRAAVSATGGSR